MKDTVKTALVQFEPSPMDEMQNNVEFISTRIRELSLKGNELIVFPELSITSFFHHSPDGKKEFWEKGAISLDHMALKQIIQTTIDHQVYVIVGFAERSNIAGVIYNSVALLGPKGIIGITKKMHLPGLEKQYFTADQEAQVFDTPLGKIGICICYDCMFPEYVRLLAAKEAEIIVFPSSIWKGGNKGGIGSIGSKERFWDGLPAVRAMENQSYVIACNGGGIHNMGLQSGHWERIGLSKIVSPTGQILAQTHGNEECVLEASLFRSILEETRSIYTFLSDRKPHLYNQLTIGFD